MEPGDQLEQRAASGDAKAKFDLALELMCGPEGSEQIQRWLALVEEASNAGHAPATELWAIFEAMGVARPQDWDRAFDLLEVAANQGSAGARRQLLILARRDGEHEDHADWAEVRASISLPQLLEHGDRISLSNQPRIRVIESFASQAECAWLIDRTRPRLKPALIIDPTGSHVINPDRSNTGTEFLVQDMDLVMEVIRHRISAATRIPVPVFEPTQVLHYEVGQEFRPHFDFLDPANPNYNDLLGFGQRIATFLIYLNGEFSGGETQFPDVGIQFSGKTGDAIFWANVDMDGQPDRLTRHAGLPPSSGEKWVLSQWIRDRSAARR